MTPLHASDPMGAAAHRAAMLVARMDFRLLAASSPTMDREQRAQALSLFFAQWPKVCRAVAELEATAPTAASQGYAEDAKATDFIEGRPG